MDDRNYHSKNNISKVKSQIPETVELVKIRKCNVEDIMALEEGKDLKMKRKSRKICIDCSIVSQLEVLEDTVKNTINEIKIKSSHTSDTEETDDTVLASGMPSEDHTNKNNHIEEKIDATYVCMPTPKTFQKPPKNTGQYSCVCGMVSRQERLRKFLGGSSKKTAPMKPPTREAGDCRCKKTHIEAIRVPVIEQSKKNSPQKLHPKEESGEETEVTPILFARRSSSIAGFHNRCSVHKIKYNRSKSLSPAIFNIFSRSNSKIVMQTTQSSDTTTKFNPKETVDRCIMELQKVSDYLRTNPSPSVKRVGLPAEKETEKVNGNGKEETKVQQNGKDTYTLSSNAQGKTLNDNDSKLVICIKGNKEEKDVNIVIKQCPNCKTCFKNPPNNIVTDADQSIQEILSILENDGSQKKTQATDARYCRPVTYTTNFMEDLPRPKAKFKSPDPQLKIEKNGQFCLCTEDGKEFLISIDVKRKSDECLKKSERVSSYYPVFPPRMDKSPVKSRICSSLDFDVTLVDTKLRDKGIDHPDPKIVVCLREIGVNNLLLASRPAKCCKKIVLNQRLKKSMPYAPSLRSLPLDERDLRTIKNQVKKKLKKQALRKKSSYNVFYMHEQKVKDRHKMNYYINLETDGEKICDTKIVMSLFSTSHNTYNNFFNYYIYLDDKPVKNLGIFDVMFFEIKKYSPNKSTQGNSRNDQRSKNSYVYLRSRMQKYGQKSNTQNSEMGLGETASSCEAKKLVLVEVNQENLVMNIPQPEKKEEPKITEILAKPNVDFHNFVKKSSVSIQWGSQVSEFSTISEIYGARKKKKRKKEKYCLSRSKSDCSLSKIGHNLKISTLSLEVKSVANSSSHLIHHYINNLWYREFINDLCKDDYRSSEDNTSRGGSWNSYLIGELTRTQRKETYDLPSDRDTLILDFKEDSVLRIPSQPNVDAFNEDYEKRCENKAIKAQKIQTDDLNSLSNMFIHRKRSELWMDPNFDYRQKKCCKHRQFIKQLYELGVEDCFPQWGHGDFQNSNFFLPTESQFTMSTLHSSSVMISELLAKKYRNKRRNMANMLRHYLELIDQGELAQEYWIYHNNSPSIFQKAKEKSKSLFRKTRSDQGSKSVTIAYSKPENVTTFESTEDFHLLCQKCGRYIRTDRDQKSLNLSNFCTCKFDELLRKNMPQRFDRNNILIVAPAADSITQGDELEPSKGFKTEQSSELVLVEEKPTEEITKVEEPKEDIKEEDKKVEVIVEPKKSKSKQDKIKATSKSSLKKSRSLIKKDKKSKSNVVDSGAGSDEPQYAADSQTNTDSPATKPATVETNKEELTVKKDEAMLTCISTMPEDPGNKYMVCPGRNQAKEEKSKDTQTMCKCKGLGKPCVHCQKLMGKNNEPAQSQPQAPPTNERACGKDSQKPSDTLLKICVFPSCLRRKPKPKPLYCPCCNSRLNPTTKANLQKFIEQWKRDRGEKEPVVVSHMATNNVKRKKSTPSTSAQTECEQHRKKVTVCEEPVKPPSRMTSFCDNLSAEAFLEQLFDIAAVSPTTDDSCQSEDFEYECESSSVNYRREKRKYRDVLYALTKMKRTDSSRSSTHDCLFVKDENVIIVHKKK